MRFGVHIWAELNPARGLHSERNGAERNGTEQGTEMTQSRLHRPGTGTGPRAPSRNRPPPLDRPLRDWGVASPLRILPSNTTPTVNSRGTTSAPSPAPPLSHDLQRTAAGPHQPAGAAACMTAGFRPACLLHGAADDVSLPAASPSLPAPLCRRAGRAGGWRPGIVCVCAVWEEACLLVRRPWPDLVPVTRWR